jgi:hypothetical protein
MKQTITIEQAKLLKQLSVARNALRFYAEQKHFDTPDGQTRLLDNGETAGEALAELEHWDNVQPLKLSIHTDLLNNQAQIHAAIRALDKGWVKITIGDHVLTSDELELFKLMLCHADAQACL